VTVEQARKRLAELAYGKDHPSVQIPLTGSEISDAYRTADTRMSQELADLIEIERVLSIKTR
jgi:UDP-N-acetylglucosamine 2-epimerase